MPRPELIHLLMASCIVIAFTLLLVTRAAYEDHKRIVHLEGKLRRLGD